MKLHWLWILILLNVTACASKQTVMVGDEPVTINYSKGHGKTFIHLHHNEQTALRAAEAVVQREGGSIISLEHRGGRNIVFYLQGTRHEFDPNRIFSDEGIRKTLSMFGPYSLKAHQEVQKLAQKIKAILPEGKIVAVHNNAGYSLKNYLSGNSLEQEAQAVHLVPSKYFRNFYLVTQIQDYLRLKSQGFNGVLQKKAATDDGSLSVYLAKNEYINVEAGFDQLAEQIKMLQHA